MFSHFLTFSSITLPSNTSLSVTPTSVSQGVSPSLDYTLKSRLPHHFLPVLKSHVSLLAILFFTTHSQVTFLPSLFPPVTSLFVYLGLAQESFSPSMYYHLKLNFPPVPSPSIHYPLKLRRPNPPPPSLHFPPLFSASSEEVFTSLFFTKQTFVKSLVSIVFDIFLGLADFFMEMGLFQGKNIKLYLKNGDTIPAAVVFNF